MLAIYIKYMLCLEVVEVIFFDGFKKRLNKNGIRPDPKVGLCFIGYLPCLHHLFEKHEKHKTKTFQSCP